MEKFAVDLDKVLDDFELNEDRAERFAAKNKTQPKHQQPLIGRVSGRVGPKRDCYSQPEISERPRRINLVDADFAPDPNSITAARLSHPVYDGSDEFQGSGEGNTLSQRIQHQQNLNYWHHHGIGVINSFSTDDVPQPSSTVVSETPLENSNSVFRNSLSSVDECEKEENVYDVDVKDSVIEETGVVGLQNCISPSTIDKQIGVVLLENNDSEKKSDQSSANESFDTAENINEVTTSLVHDHSSGLYYASTSVQNEEDEDTPEVARDSFNSSNGYDSFELGKQQSIDRPLDLGSDNSDSKNVPLGSLETEYVNLPVKEILPQESHDNLNLVSKASPVSVVDDIREEVKPVSFQIEEDLSDSEVNRYLEELEDEEDGGDTEKFMIEKVESVNNVHRVIGVTADEITHADEREETEYEEKEFESENEEADEGNIATSLSSPEKSTSQIDLEQEEQFLNLETKMEDSNDDDEDDQEGAHCMSSIGLESCYHAKSVDCVVGERNNYSEKNVEEVEVEAGEMKKFLTGTVRKDVIDCRMESWVIEGNGRLLEGASISDGRSTIEDDSALIAVNKQEIRGIPPIRPDSLLITSVVAPAGDSPADEDDPVPMPFIIGPPGATPANPRPPSEISCNRLEVTERVAEQGDTESTLTSSVSVPLNQPYNPTFSPQNECLGASEAGGVSDNSSSNERLEESLDSTAEDSTPSPNDDGSDLKRLLDEKQEIPESGEDSSPDSGERSSLPEDVPTCGGLNLENVNSDNSTNSRSDFQLPSSSDSELGIPGDETGCTTLALGDVAPFWVPDADAPSCMACAAKFTLIKRRHHCRACGKVLCSKCCSAKARLAYMDHSEARVCMPCHNILQEAASASGGHSPTSARRYHSSRGAGDTEGASSEHSPRRRHGFGRPDPNNPMEYCSTVPPLEQVGERARAPPPTVMVPVGVLKREGSSRSKGEAKQVMFSDGIRPGGELSDLDHSPSAMSGSAKSQGLSAVQRKIANRLGKRMPGVVPPGPAIRGPISQLPTVASRIPDDALPPMVDMSAGRCVGGGEYNFEEGPDLDRLMETLKDESEPPVAFALSKNFFVLVKIITLDCCVNRVVWSFTTRGMRCVGQDEVIVLLEWLPTDKGPPRDIFCHLGALYEQAAKGNTVTELGHSTVQGMFLGSHNHGGFLYIRATFQCLRRLPLPPPPFLFGLLLHRMETPWAKVFPIRVMLRLGAEFRYYPCPLVGIRGREPVYQQIGHTIMNLLSDFRNFAYVLPSVRGMVIHMEERQTSILLPRNRLSQVERALDDSDDHVLALAASFSSTADSHLVCVQGESGESSTGSNHYHTQAINIQNKPRKVTGASFVVFNGALKASAKLTAKSSIVEDGLMVQVLPDTLATLRNALRNAEDFVIPCGPISPATPSAQQSSNDENGTASAALNQSVPDEVVIIRWVDDDKNFNVGVKSPIDGMALDGVPSIRVHNGTNYVSDTKFIRWTEVFLIQCSEASGGRSDTMDVSRISESIAHAVCLALHPYLDLLWSHALTLIAVRATLGPDSEGYEAGCGGSKLPPIYMNGLDNELVGVLHRIEARPRDGNLVLELLFHLMEL